MTAMDDVAKLFETNFEKQIVGRPRMVSEWGLVYEEFRFITVRPSDIAQRGGNNMLTFIEGRAHIAAMAAWIEWQKRTDKLNIIVWRVRPEVSNDSDFETDTYRVKTRFRAHLLTQEAFKKGPVLKATDAMTPEQQEQVERLKNSA